MIHVLGSDFRQERKNAPTTLFERANSDKIENRKNTEILLNSIKVGFLNIQNGKTQLFFLNIDLKFCTHSSASVFIHIFRVFEESKIFLENVEKRSFLMVFLTIFEISKIPKSPCSFCNCYVENHLVPSLKLYS